AFAQLVERQRLDLPGNRKMAARRGQDALRFIPRWLAAPSGPPPAARPRRPPTRGGRPAGRVFPGGGGTGGSPRKVFEAVGGLIEGPREVFPAAGGPVLWARRGLPGGLGVPERKNERRREKGFTAGGGQSYIK